MTLTLFSRCCYYEAARLYLTAGACMKFLYHSAVLVASAFVTISLTACNSKKEEKQLSPSHPPVQVAQQVPVSSKDKADADAVATQVLNWFKSGDFKSIYRHASPGFQAIGTEGQFVAAFEKIRANTGPVKDIKQTKYYGRPDNYTVYLYEVRYAKVASELRLTFGRSKEGKMELCGLNQKDGAAQKK
jgi:hypothetical protein